MKRYVSLAMPDKVLQLQAVRQKYMRIYKDEQGVVFVQQDLDHAPVSEVEAGGRKTFMALCSRERQAWEEMVTSIGRCTLKCAPWAGIPRNGFSGDVLLWQECE